MCQEGKEKTISPEMIQVLQDDNNYSLAQMGLKQHIKNRIIRLKDIFITAKVIYGVYFHEFLGLWDFYEFSQNQ